MGKRFSFSKGLLGAIAIIPIFILLGCLRPFELKDSETVTNENKILYGNLRAGMTYEEVLVIMGPPGNTAKEGTCYDICGSHMRGAIDRYWGDDYQNIVLYFDDDGRLYDKELLPSSNMPSPDKRFPCNLCEGMNVFP